MMEGAPRSPLERDGLSPRQRAEVSPLEATVITGGGSIDDGETCDEPTTTMGRRRRAAARCLVLLDALKVRGLLAQCVCTHAQSAR